MWNILIMSRKEIYTKYLKSIVKVNFITIILHWFFWLFLTFKKKLPIDFL